MKVYVYKAQYENGEEKKVEATRNDMELVKKIVIANHGSKGLKNIIFSHFYYIPY